eukprot:928718-Pleurochrysis_carterae.AAC.1
MAKASLFWLLHAGHLMLPGGRDPKVYNSYRAEAVLFRSRPSECALPVQANLECARAPVPPNGRRLRRDLRPRPRRVRTIQVDRLFRQMIASLDNT